MADLPTLEEFEGMCKEQDFHYFHSDDYNVYLKGKAKQDKLQKVVREGGVKYLDVMIKIMGEQGA